MFLESIFSSPWFLASGIDKKILLESLDRHNLNYADLFKEFMTAIARAQGKRKWVEKTPWHILYIGEIQGVFPNCKYIHIVRDPRDVALSVCNYGWQTGSFSVQRVLVAWKWHLKKAERDFADFNSKVLTLKYEDLVLSPESSVKRLKDFLMIRLNFNHVKNRKNGIIKSGNSAYDDKISGISSSPVGRWKKRLPLHLQSDAEFLIGDYLTKYGYEMATSLRPIQSRRWLFLFMAFAYSLLKDIKAVLFPLCRK